jgi:hypothetical protein
MDGLEPASSSVAGPLPDVARHRSTVRRHRALGRAIRERRDSNRDLRRARPVPLFDAIRLRSTDLIDASWLHSTLLDSTRHELVRSARTALAPAWPVLTPVRRKDLQIGLFRDMERAGFEPAASGLQTQPITRPRLTSIDRIGMTEPRLAISTNVIRHRSTPVRSHRARTVAASTDNPCECSATEDRRVGQATDRATPV